MTPLFEPPERFHLADYLLTERLREGAGDRVALAIPGSEITYAQIDDLARRWASVLTEIGVRPEERVLIALPDGLDFVAALFGVLHAGAVVVMVNPDLEAERLADLMEYSRAACAVVDERVLPAFAAAAAATDRPPRIVTPAAGRTAHPSFESLDPGAGGAYEGPGTHRDDPAIWLFSGGTTGRPKAVVQTHRSFANTTELYAKAALGYSRDDVTLSVPKLFFGYATGSNLFFPFAVGATAVLFPERATPERLFELIESRRPTLLVNVPTMVRKMVAHPQASERDLSCLRFATSAGEALPAPLYHRWKETFGVELLDGLGTAEMWHIFLSNLPGAVRPGTLGRVVPGFEIDVRDPEGRPLPPGEVGRLWVRGASRALGYWRNLPKTAEAFRGEWFVGGDLVVRDEEGWVTYCGRSDDVLKVGGKWLAPQEVESCLMRHPAVAECAVVGAEDADGLIKPTAFVVRAAGAGADDLEETLKAWVLEHLQPYKHPRRVVVLDELPRTHLGKADRAKLKRLAGA
ncbi:MAG: benzoate-CoA ligase family protein [Thermoanaerobaculia bacterium]|nr:benzoate-CoA ligase family protein [Thermoanaerobaculia bacterium]